MIVRLAGGDARRALTYLEESAAGAAAVEPDHDHDRHGRACRGQGGGPLRP